MPCSSSNRRATSRHNPASPTQTGTIWLGPSSRASPAASSAAFSAAARSASAARRAVSVYSARTLASAAAATAGGSAVVKISPPATLRM